ncbi:hypothetical protein [Aliarcobacter skirrowii]|uniref:hypothetical protein n=1 Tax=Aliarcobacter skirrowii TaxID=28200 RepID=UPI000835BD4A|nr:hypothetical protein [Aliarcobacter skirrowii]
MNKYLKNNKKMIRVGLLEDEIKMIEQQAKLTGDSISQTGRNLILAGLQNLEIAENLKDNVKFSIGKIERKHEEFDKKIMKILMLILKESCVSKSFLENFEEKKSGKSREDYLDYLDKLEKHSITKMFSKLREKEDESV